MIRTMTSLLHDLCWPYLGYLISILKLIVCKQFNVLCKKQKICVFRRYILLKAYAATNSCRVMVTNVVLTWGYEYFMEAVMSV